METQVINMSYGYYNMVDEFNQPIERTPSTHPYSYDGFVTYRNGKNEEANTTIYSDRLSQWDYVTTRRLMSKHFEHSGDYWENRTPQSIENFLREYTGDNTLKLIFIMQYCNQSSGYPLWRFELHSEKRKLKVK